jgi:endonuclease/exonuclease/phosphatase family metal-dependent hydrolase
MRRRTVPLVLAAAVVASALWSAPVAGAAGSSPAAVAPIRLRVMSFNIRYGAHYSTIQAVVKAIVAARADVVGIDEPFGKTRKIARLLGWHAAPRLHTISRYPILQPPGSVGRWGYLLVGPGRVVAIANNHNPSSPYGPNLVREGEPRAEVLRKERGRLRWQQHFLDVLAPLVAGGLPVFFVGDFNSPSWRDWTPKVVRALGWQPPTVHALGPRYAVRWPCSLAIEHAGFKDSYRVIHPSAIRNPGFTWTSGHPGLAPWDVNDRIDFVWYAGSVTPLASQVVGPPSPWTNIVSRPWPSDHRAVVSTFDVVPAKAPTYVAPYDVRVYAGHNVRASFHAPPGAGRMVGVWTRGSDPSTDPDLVSRSIANGAVNGVKPLPTTGLAPGDYVLALVDGNMVLSRVIFSVVDPAAPATITVSKHHFAVGQAIGVTWTSDPGNRFDWLGLTRGAGTPAVYPLLEWQYIQARIFGSARIDAGARGAWPLPPGRYRVSLCIDDDYRCIASTDAFTIG